MTQAERQPDAAHTDDGTDADVEASVVDQSYDAALEPRRLTDLVTLWDKVFVPNWRLSAQTRRAHLDRSGMLRHLGRLEKILKLGAQASRSSAQDRALDRFHRAAAFTLDAKLRITVANSAAGRMLGLRRGQALRDLRIGDDDLARLSMTVQALLTGEAPGGQPTRIVRARRVTDDRPILFLVHHVPGAEDEADFVLVATTDIHWTPQARTLLRDAFHLTEAEAEVMIALTRHHSLKNIAAARGRSLATVRSQVKSLQAKTEARGQSELLRIALSLMDIAPGDTDRISPRSDGTGLRVSRGGAELSPLPFRQIVRPDGRRFDYLDFGDPEGRPVIFLSSSFGTCRWPATAEFAAEQSGLRIIAPIRSGYGGSSPLAPGDDRLDCFAQDVLAVMDKLVIGAAQVIVLDEDMPYVARLFRHAPDRIHSILGSSAFLPLTRPEQYERMGRWHRFMLGTARYVPALLPFVVRLGFAMARQIGKAEFVRQVYAGSPADVAMTRVPRLFEAVESGSDVILSEGFEAARAYAQEISIVHRSDWRSEFEAMRDRVQIVDLIGTEDQGITAETIAEYRADYPWVTIIPVEGAGSFLFFQKWDMVLQHLKRMAHLPAI